MEKYKKLSQREHVLLRPGMYMGDIHDAIEDVWVLGETNVLTKKTLKYNPGIVKLFDEIVLNASDHARENPNASEGNPSGKKVTSICVIANETSLSIYNNGSGIPTGIHPEYNVHVPELIFSHFLTGSNYDDTTKRLKAGLNGLGAKLTSAFSTTFTVETVHQGKKYTQTFRDNLSVVNPPKIQSTKSKEYTRVTFTPDFKRFKTTNITQNTLDVIHRRTLDIAAVTPARVTFNGTNVSVKSFSDYVNLFNKTTKAVYECDRWNVAVCASDDGFDQVSFVNGVHTLNGGTHVAHIVNPIVQHVTHTVRKKAKDVEIKPSFVKENLFVIVFAFIENPSFKSQAKEELVTRPKDFGSSCAFPDTFFKKIDKLGIAARVHDILRFRENKALAASDGKKKSRLTGIPKLDDANFAGGKQSQKCTLILTEGDSAKTFAVSGISLIGRDTFGIFPLRGKLLNVRQATARQLSGNEEIRNLKAILGLQNGKSFKTLKALKRTMRYGKVLILTDADVDGHHIKGLLINFFHAFWPQLVLEDDFVTCLQTPIVKAFKGKTQKAFYSLAAYNQWKNRDNPTGQEGRAKGWTIKYYKGLGTSSAEEARDCFRRWENITFRADETTEQSIRLAFERERTHERKEWIQKCTGKDLFLAPDKTVPYTDFFNQEFVQFSIADNVRSIPNVMDGLKPSQRKVLFGARKKNCVQDIKVDQLRGFIGEHTAYHHGDASLNETIVGMAHDFVGSNNINFLLPSGQLGTRRMGGKDAASPRYIFTKLSPLVDVVFPPEDNCILDYLDEDGYTIEPAYFLPCIPTVLVNGASGIGTGYSTDIPKYNPLDLIECTLRLMDHKDLPELVPWYRHFKGTVERKNDTTFTTKGTFTRNGRTITVHELPIGMWTQKYQEHLESLIESEDIDDYRNLSTDTDAVFEIETTNTQIEEWPSIEKKLKLTSDVHTRNMVLFDETRALQVYDTVHDILKAFFRARRPMYAKRKAVMETDLQHKVTETQYKVVFVQKVIDGAITVFRVKRANIETQLKTHNFPEETFDTLLNIKLSQFTEEKVESLEKDLARMEHELESLRARTPDDLWRDDLCRLKKELLKQKTYKR